MSFHSCPSPSSSLFRNTVMCRKLTDWNSASRYNGYSSSIGRSIDRGRSIDMRASTDVIAIANRSLSRFSPPPPNSYATTIMRIWMRNALLKRIASPTAPPIDTRDSVETLLRPESFIITSNRASNSLNKDESAVGESAVAVSHI